MEVTMRRVVSVEDATAKLNGLARRNGITNPRYDESEADSMPEFDALEWTCLCSQRVALQKRESGNVSRDCQMPEIFRSFYGHKASSTSVELENTDEGQFRIAA